MPDPNTQYTVSVEVPDRPVPTGYTDPQPYPMCCVTNDFQYTAEFL